MAALRDLCVADHVIAQGAPVEAQSFRSWRGHELLRAPVGELARRNGIDPPTMISRGDLLRLLADAAGPDTVRFGTELAGFDDDGEGVDVALADGSTMRARALIGADGLDSRIRAAVVPSSSPRFAGYQYLRALTRFDDFPQGAFHFTLGPGDRFGAHDVGDGAVYWFGVVVHEPGSGDPPEGRKAELLSRFGNFPAPVRELIEATPEDEIARSDIRDLPPLPAWGAGRVTLLGDAAHATTPNLGRGAGEALDDAVDLAHRLAAADSSRVATALRAYEEHRRPLAAVVQRRSRRIGDLFSRRNPIVVRGRELVLRRIAGPALIRDMEAEFAALGSRS
jgi:2-polyprenyl-6-methoxyphenol hydroxylase-like FAD-dependent oxidoreductase